ncbi:MAG TPA: hypothetical protein PKE69_04305 [Pyrinomonadaceae bacterium]|nr:hypothetical protein [Pyrinomonadaceae bacterium]
MNWKVLFYELPSALAEGQDCKKKGFSRICKIDSFLTALAKAKRMIDIFLILAKACFVL